MKKTMLLAAAFAIAVALPCAAERDSSGQLPKLQSGSSFKTFAASDNKKAALSGELKGKVCPQMAKLCPDGSSVGMTGPNCEFAKCPGEEAASGAAPKCGSCAGCAKCPDKANAAKSSGKAKEILKAQAACPMAKTCPDGSTVARIRVEERTYSNEFNSGVSTVCVYEECPAHASSGTVCPAMAKICPDGSSVGMVAAGGKCEFAKCPGE
jgi:hypothetical protein